MSYDELQTCYECGAEIDEVFYRGPYALCLECFEDARDELGEYER